MKNDVQSKSFRKFYNKTTAGVAFFSCLTLFKGSHFVFDWNQLGMQASTEIDSKLEWSLIPKSFKRANKDAKIYVVKFKTVNDLSTVY